MHFPDFDAWNHSGLNAQESKMCSVADEPSLQPTLLNPPANSLQCPGAAVDFGDYDLVTPIAIYVNVHFRPTNTGENFDPATAVTLANKLVATANDYLNNMEQNEKPGPSGAISPHVPKAKWQYKIYTENLPGDDLGAFGSNQMPIQGCTTAK